ncbi:unnamed protein product [Strongylus vulgaris]|uniref:Uncharacterized protein n=1 Tax=Strongylus vulgaris TaxID=40348 RepID=A0A3P7JPX5_STRVU|nr:unnamed protein product [Strongylus vulgaris]
MRRTLPRFFFCLDRISLCLKLAATGGDECIGCSSFEGDTIPCMEAFQGTISIYDFPSMKNSMENPHKNAELVHELTPTHQCVIADRNSASPSDIFQDKKHSPIPVALVHPLPSTPTGEDNYVINPKKDDAK